MSDYPFLKSKEPQYSFLTPKEKSDKSYGDSFGANFREGFVQGGKGLAGGAAYAAGAYTDFLGYDFSKDLQEWGKEYSKDVPDPDGSYGQWFGQLVPSIIPTAGAIASAPFTGGGSLVAYGAAGSLGLASAGMGMMEYEDYKKSKGEDVSNGSKLAVGTAYGVAEMAMERIGLSKLMPKGAKMRMIGNPAQAEKAGRELLASFKKAQPKKANTILKKLATGSAVEGTEESMTELFQAITDNVYRDKEDRFNASQIVERMGHALAGGALMGSGMGVMSYAAQSKIHADRRKKSGTVLLGEIDGEAKELMGRKEDKVTGAFTYTVMDGAGNVSEVPGEKIKQKFELPTDQFYNVIKGKVAESEAIEEAKAIQYNQDRQELSNFIDQTFLPNVKEINGVPSIALAKVGDSDVIVKGVNTAQGNRAAIVPIDNPDVQPTLISFSEIKDTYTVLPFDQFKAAQLGEEVDPLVERNNYPHKGQVFEFEAEDGKVLPGRVTGYDPNTNEASVQIGEGDNVEFLTLPKEEVMKYAQTQEQQDNPEDNFDDEGNVVTKQTVNEEESREVTVNGKELRLNKQSPGVYRADFITKDKKEAEKTARGIKESLPNLKTKVVALEAEDDFTPPDYQVEIISPKEQGNAENQGTKEASSNNVEPEKDVDSPGTQRVSEGVQQSGERIKGSGEGNVDGGASRDIQPSTQPISEDTQTVGRGVRRNSSSEQEGGAGLEPDVAGKQPSQPGSDIKEGPQGNTDIQEGTQESEVSQEDQESTQEGDSSGVSKSAGEAITATPEESSSRKSINESDNQSSDSTGKSGDASGTNESINADNQQQKPKGTSEESVGGSGKAKSADGKPSRSNNKNTGRGRKKDSKGDAGSDQARTQKVDSKQTDTRKQAQVKFEDLLSYFPEITLDGADETNIQSKVRNGPFWPQSKQRVESEVNRIVKKWKNKPPIKVWETALDFDQWYKIQSGKRIPGVQNVAGVFFNGRIHVIASHRKFKNSNTLSAEVEDTILHEAVGHFGLRGLALQTALRNETSMTDELNEILDEVSESYKGNLKMDAIARTYYGSFGVTKVSDFDKVDTMKKITDATGSDWDMVRREMAEEFIAHNAQMGTSMTMQEKIISFVRKLWRQLTGRNLKLNDNDVLTLLANSRQFVEVGDSFVRRIPRVPDVVRAERPTQPKQNLRIYGQKPGESKPPKEGVKASAVRFQKLSGPEALSKFKGDATEYSGSDIQNVKSGEKVLLNVYHGTTNEFYEFDSSVKGNIEGHLGKINYFTSDEQDAAQNYQSDGADLTSRIELRKERLEDELGEYPEEEIDELSEKYGLTYNKDTETYPENLPLKIAEEELKGGEEQVLDLHVKLNNPLVLGKKSTWVEAIPFEDYEDYMDDAAEEIAEEYDVDIEEAKEDYDFEVRQRAQEAAGIWENRIVEAMSQAIFNNTSSNDIDASEVLGDSSYESEIDLNQLEQNLRKNENLSYAENEEGELSSSQIIADFFENLGYDGIILTDVSERFKQLMSGFGDQVSHVHVFDQYNNQIKLADGQNTTYDEGTSDIRFQRSQAEEIMKSLDQEVSVNFIPAKEISGKDINLSDMGLEDDETVTAKSVQKILIDNYKAYKKLHKCIR